MKGGLAMECEAVVASTSEMLDYETVNKTAVVIVDN